MRFDYGGAVLMARGFADFYFISLFLSFFLSHFVLLAKSIFIQWLRCSQCIGGVIVFSN